MYVLNILPSIKNISQNLNKVGQGNVLVKIHKNHSVIYIIGSILCFFYKLKKFNIIQFFIKKVFILYNVDRLTKSLYICGSCSFNNAKSILPS